MQFSIKLIIFKTINIVLLQWIFLRIVKEVDAESNKHLGYRLVFPVIPLTNKLIGGV